MDLGSIYPGVQPFSNTESGIVVECSNLTPFWGFKTHSTPILATQNGRFSCLVITTVMWPKRPVSQETGTVFCTALDKHTLQLTRSQLASAHTLASRKVPLKGYVSKEDRTNSTTHKLEQ